MTRSRWSRSTLLAVLALGWAGCVFGDRNELEAQREAWESVRPAHYSYDYTGTGFMGIRGPWRIEVRGDQVLSVTWEGEGEVHDGELTPEYASTIDELFDGVSSSMADSDVDEVDVEYDAQWHFPTRASYSVGEEGYGFRAGNLTPLD
jgi:hypothetical protein